MIHLLTEGNKELNNRTFPLPKGIREYLTNVLHNYNGSKDVDGYDRLNNILQMKHVTYQEMKRLKNFFDNFQGDVKSDEYQLNGGDALKTWVNNTLNTATSAIRNFKQAKKDLGIKNAFIKHHSKDGQTKSKFKPTQSKFKTKDLNIKIGKGEDIKYESKNINKMRTICITESQYKSLLLNEAQDDVFSLEELSAIKSFRGRYNYCVQHIGNHVGKGSSRATFQLSDEKVLKLAINEKGIAQNSQEGQKDYYLEQLDVIPKLFETDDDYKWIISEYVLPAKAQDFKVCLGVDENTFYRFIITDWVERCGTARDKQIQEYNMLSKGKYEELLENENLIPWDDYIGNYRPSYGDMVARRNYGMTMRNGYPTIVLLDSGLTDEIWNQYYNR
jgi:hypothetical protein